MKILYLGPESPIADYVRDDGNNVLRYEGKNLEAAMDEMDWVDWLVSYRYRYIVPRGVLDYFYGRTVNLHTSLLPYNRGTHPNFWSWIDDTPKGVSLHRMWPGLDTGPIYANAVLLFENCDFSFHDTYEILDREIVHLFKRYWPRIADEWQLPVLQVGSFTYHRTADLERMRFCLPEGWDTPINVALELLRTDVLV